MIVSSTCSKLNSLRSAQTLIVSLRALSRRFVTSSKVGAAAQLPPRPVVKEEDIEEAFLKGSGPGGQKIVCEIFGRLPLKEQPLNMTPCQNKTSSAVQLKHIPTGTVMKSQATRSRTQNRKIARRLLAEKVEAIEKGPESRAALKAGIQRKKKASKSKKARRKHKKLQAEEGCDQVVVQEGNCGVAQEGSKQEPV